RLRVMLGLMTPEERHALSVELLGQKLDKDVFRRDLGNLTDAYTEVAKRLGILPENGQVPKQGPKLVH
ncbi:MAG: hypothetical protein AAFN05_15700, partial [Pseudomonadota bacterium]